MVGAAEGVVCGGALKADEYCSRAGVDPVVGAGAGAGAGVGAGACVAVASQQTTGSGQQCFFLWQALASVARKATTVPKAVNVVRDFIIVGSPIVSD